MALRLKLEREPYWIELGHGVSVQVRPLTTAIWESARYAAHREIDTLKEERRHLEELGAEISGLPNLANDDTALGLAHALLIRNLAREAIVAWDGVYPAEGDEPAPVDDDNVAMLMDIQLIARRFYDRYTAALGALVAEGEGYGASPNGASATAPNIAPDADRPGSAAPAENADTTDDAVHTSNTRH